MGGGRHAGGPGRRRTTSRFHRRLAVIVVLGAAWRFGFVVATKLHRELLLNDSLYYSWQGVQLADFVWFRDITRLPSGARSTVRSRPSCSPRSAGEQHALFQQRLATTLCGVATVARHRARRSAGGGDRVGLVAAGAGRVYPNLWINDGLVMSESLGCLLVAAVLLVDPAAVSSNPRPGKALVCGALIGLGRTTVAS